MRYHGHKQEVQLLLPLGDQLISSDCGGEVIVWDVQGGRECPGWGWGGADPAVLLPIMLLSTQTFTSS